MDSINNILAKNCKRKAATTASQKLSRKHASCFRRVSGLLRKKNKLTTLSEEEMLFLRENSDLVNQFYKRREKRAENKRRLTEQEDSLEVLETKCLELAQAIHDAEFLVVYTGAGISTAASIPDYRGPNGIWTRLKRGQDIGIHDLTVARPTLTHMAVSGLYNKGIVKHVVSQNCDGLHLRSGLPKTALSELHGNMYIEVCKRCRPAREYLRIFDVTENTSTFKHKTGRRCYRCGEALVDTIVHFGERGKLRWPLNWQGACQAAGACDTILCLGSSLKVLRRYSWLWQMDRPVKRRPRLYIVNLQWTSKDKDATLKINGKCDDVIELVMKYLGLRIPRYVKKEDPIFQMHTPLHSDEICTFSQHAITLSDSSSEDDEDDGSSDSNCIASQTSYSDRTTPRDPAAGVKESETSPFHCSSLVSLTSSVIVSSILSSSEDAFSSCYKQLLNIVGGNRNSSHNVLQNSQLGCIDQSPKQTVNCRNVVLCDRQKDESTDLAAINRLSAILKQCTNTENGQKIRNMFEHTVKADVDVYQLIKQIIETKIKSESETEVVKCESANEIVNTTSRIIKTEANVSVKREPTADEAACRSTTEAVKCETANEIENATSTIIKTEANVRVKSELSTEGVKIEVEEGERSNKGTIAKIESGEQFYSSDKKRSEEGTSLQNLKMDLNCENLLGGLPDLPLENRAMNDRTVESSDTIEIAANNSTLNCETPNENEFYIDLTGKQEELFIGTVELVTTDSTYNNAGKSTTGNGGDGKTCNHLQSCSVEEQNSGSEIDFYGTGLCIRSTDCFGSADEGCCSAEDVESTDTLTNVTDTDAEELLDPTGESQSDGVIQSLENENLSICKMDERGTTSTTLDTCEDAEVGHELKTSNCSHDQEEAIPVDRRSSRNLRKRTILNGIYKSQKSKVKKSDSDELREIWCKSFATEKPQEVLDDEVKPQMLDDEVKQLWFWGFDAMDKLPPKRLTRSSFHTDRRSTSPKSKKCNCGLGNPQLCEKWREEQNLNSPPPEDKMVKVRETLKRRRVSNYVKYEPVFEIRLTDLINRKRMRKRRIWYEESDSGADSEAKLSSATDGVASSLEDAGENKGEDKKICPGWYGKGYAKVNKKRKHCNPSNSTISA